MSVCIDVLPSSDVRYPWRVRIVTRDEHGVLVGVRHIRAYDEREAQAIAEQYRGRNARDDIATSRYDNNPNKGANR